MYDNVSCKGMRTKGRSRTSWQKQVDVNMLEKGITSGPTYQSGMEDKDRTDLYNVRENCC